MLHFLWFYYFNFILLLLINKHKMNSEYWRLFNNEKPEKQAKSYEIDLGQTVRFKI